ncbi:MAG: STAS domain-containing protein [Planctomycetaceae bacterium]|nr:STAS domain-containing protein [Planctomycetaceae bacterium]
MSQEPFFDTRLIDDDILAVLLRGSLDSTTTEEFDREIQKHLDEGRSKIIIDCRYLDNLSSMGIGRLVALQTRLRRKAGAVKLATIHGPAAEVIKLVGLGNILEIYGDLEFARQSFYQ